MTSFESGREVITEIDGKSTISELIGLLISSFQSKEFKLVERILMKREDDLKAQLKKEQQDRCLFERKHANVVLGMLEMQDDLKKLKNENSELREELKMLRMEKLETAQKFLDYEVRVANLEKAMANVFRVDVSETQRLACGSLENVLQKEGNSNLDCERTLENTSDHHNYAQAFYGAPSPSNGPGSKTNSSHQEIKSFGCDDRTSKRRKDLLDDHSNAQIGIEGAQDTSRVCIDSVKLEKENDNLYAAGPCAAASKSINRTCDTPRSPIVVEIIESDDEAPGVEKPFVSNTCPPVLNSSKKGVTFMASGRNACPTEDKNERNVRIDPLESLPVKRKRGLTETDDSGISPVCKQRIEIARELLHDGKGSAANNFSVKIELNCSGSQSGMPYSQSQRVNEQCQGLQRKLDFLSSDDSSDYSSSDSDDDCSESFISEMIQSLRQDCRKSQKTWSAETDMRLEFLSNDELCMNAVCALYRKQISKGKFINCTSNPIDLDMFNTKSGKDIAEYLIDGDPECKLKRTVSEVQEKDSTLLGRCKALAIGYHKTLFEIYRKNEDPFFPPSS